MQSVSIATIVHPGRRFRLPDGTVVRAVASDARPDAVVLYAVNDSRLWFVQPDGGIIKQLNERELTAEGFDATDDVQSPTGWSVFDLEPILTPWERASVPSWLTKEDMLEDMHSPSLRVATAMLVDMTMSSKGNPRLNGTDPNTPHAVVEWDLDHVLVEPEPPIARMQIASGADPADVRELLRELNNRIDVILEDMMTMRRL